MSKTSSKWLLSRFFANALMMFCFVVAGALNNSGAQTVQPKSITGKVKDKDGAPVSGAKISIFKKSTGALVKQTVADDAGQYQVDSLEEGSYLIKAEPNQHSGSLLPVGLKDLKIDSLTTQGSVADLTTGIVESGGGTPSADFVRVSLNAVAGPLGYIATPSLTSATQTNNAQTQALIANQDYYYPSIIFYMSASPLVNIPNDATANLDKSVKSAQETNRNPNWLDAEFTITPVDSNGKALKGCGLGEGIEVLGALPQQTVGSTKNQKTADVATAINNVASGLASFYPGVSTQVGAASSAMNVVFQDLFPPQPIAFQYTSVSGNCDVDWFFRPNAAAGATVGASSILGTQTGILMLKVPSSIKRLQVEGVALSEWNKAPSETSKKLFQFSKRTIAYISLPDPDAIDYKNLTSLAMFPSLIDRLTAMKILRIGTDVCAFETFAATNKIVTTDGKYQFVTNASLANALTQTAAPSSPSPMPTLPDCQTAPGVAAPSPN
ncbi:carboxypeptidase-like regulatory domain-containing protein [Granulicella mallensis]|uniref:Cna B domain protein n=1 Tax=Granulicella mallensis (strain ATCC BAA-1857 / DSM 23137 / MP5ACTX8) TaxID=682795 RepID=G8NT28_GRAMM|nr:carboxypeptidase-like regulatory domain-containing protein [Granulicella mallensis]AEU37458.1 hypothetical protein AciX8_3156 [Granulicella mallensis MP5ACTX8]